MIYLLPHVRDVRLRVAWLATVGRDSLFYYLWHPLAFGIWAGFGMRGMTMLAVSLATLIAVRMLLVRQASIATIFGIATRKPEETMRHAGDGAPQGAVL